MLFNTNSRLTAFNVNLGNMTDGSSMFNTCSNLTTFNGDLSSLETADYMFCKCTSLTSFTSNLANFTTGGDSIFGYSINNCTKLDLTSVQNIATTINDLASQGNTGKITIGIAVDLRGNSDLEAALATIRSKGWTVTEIYKS